MYRPSIIFDDLFQTAFTSSKADEGTTNQICDEVFENSREIFAEAEYEDGKLVYQLLRCMKYGWMKLVDAIELTS